jgi:hypothetical protein
MPVSHGKKDHMLSNETWTVKPFISMKVYPNSNVNLNDSLLGISYHESVEKASAAGCPR